MFYILRTPAVQLKNEKLKKFCGLITKSDVTYVNNNPGKNNHSIYAARAMYLFKMKNYKSSQKLMKKAIDMKPPGKSLIVYKAILKNVIDKKVE